ncbi:MAG: hypothetical protein ABEJ81_03730 [Haloferacaceae archaeon]
MPKQIVFDVKGIDGDAFQSAAVVFPESLGGTRGGDETIVRKKLGRRATHQVVLVPSERIPEPERAIDVTVNLYDGSNVLVASGTDTVAPPGSAAVTDPDRLLKRLDRMLATIEEIRGVLRACEDDRCATVLEHSFVRMDYTRSARSAVTEGEYGAATASLRSVKEIVEGDVELLAGGGTGAIHREALSLERKLLGETTAALGAVPGDDA